MTKAELNALADRVAALDGADEKVDVLIECVFNDCRPNSAGTKVIFNNKGREEVYWARDFTRSQWTRDRAAASLRARAEMVE